MYENTFWQNKLQMVSMFCKFGLIHKKIIFSAQKWWKHRQKMHQLAFMSKISKNVCFWVSYCDIDIFEFAAFPLVKISINCPLNCSIICCITQIRRENQRTSYTLFSNVCHFFKNIDYLLKVLIFLETFVIKTFTKVSKLLIFMLKVLSFLKLLSSIDQLVRTNRNKLKWIEQKQMDVHVAAWKRSLLFCLIQSRK